MRGAFSLAKFTRWLVRAAFAGAGVSACSLAMTARFASRRLATGIAIARRFRRLVRARVIATIAVRRAVSVYIAARSGTIAIDITATGPSGCTVAVDVAAA